MDLNFEHLRGALKLISSGATTGSLDALAISGDDWDLVVGSESWLARDRARVCRTLQSLVHGAADAVSIPRIKVPAEWIAGVVACVVHPVNVYVACVYLSDVMQSVERQAAGDIESERVSPEQLFALIVEAYSVNVDGFRSKFSKFVGAAQSQVLADSAAEMAGK